MSERPDVTSNDIDLLPVFAFFNEIGIISQLANASFDRMLPEDMTRAQFGVLNHFVRLGGERTPQRLARAFQVTKGAMTGTLKHLEAKKLIAIRPDEKDGRSKLVSITDEGRAMREQCLAALVPEMTKVAEAFPTADIAAMVSDLSAIRAWLDEQRN